MRRIISFFLLIFLLTNCTPIKVQTDVPYQSPEFRSSDLKTGGLAFLPTANREYDRVIFQHAKQYLQPYVGDSYLQPRTVARKLNATNTLADYRSAVETYQKTGISDQEKFRNIGTALGVRYLMKIEPGIITTQQEAESTSYIYDDEIDIDSNEIRKNTTFAIIIDCSSGEVVWEGFSKSTADESDEFYNRPEDREIIGKSVSELMERLFYKRKR